MKILLIEPNRSLLNSLNRFLSSLGHECSLTFDGVIGVNEFDASFDLVIIDENTPRISYLETIELLKKKKPELMVFALLNSFVISSDTLLANELVDEFFSSPFVASELKFALENIKLFKDKSEIKFTIREHYLLRLLEKNKYLNIGDIDKKVLRLEQIPPFIEGLNGKLKNKTIINEEKGFKLVDKND